MILMFFELVYEIKRKEILWVFSYDISMSLLLRLDIGIVKRKNIE